MKLAWLVGLWICTSLGTASAQQNPFKNSTWKIERNAQQNKLVLHKAKRLNLPQEKANYHFIQFTDGRKFDTGTECFFMRGDIIVSGNRLRLSSNASDMAEGCELPFNMEGAYTFSVLGDEVILQPIDDSDAEDENVEEPDVEVDEEMEEEAPRKSARKRAALEDDEDESPKRKKGRASDTDDEED
jgi:hypothetical protein